MEPTEAIAFVRRYNAWRRNNDDSEMPHPKDIGESLDALCDHAERLERELAEVMQSLAFQTQLNREVVEREKQTNADLCADRAEIEQIKATLANPHAVHLNMLHGTIQWTPANLRHLLGET